MKLLVAITDGSVGGAQTFIYRRYKNFSRDKVIFICTSDGNLTSSLKKLGFEVYTSNKFFVIIKMIDLVQKKNISLISCNSTLMGLHGRLVAFICNRKALYISHGWGYSYQKSSFIKFSLKILEQILAKLNYKILCVSENDLKKAQYDLKIKNKNLQLLRHDKFKEYKIQVPLNSFCIPMRSQWPKRYDLVRAIAIENKFIDFYCYGLCKEESMALNLPKNMHAMGIVEYVPYQKYDGVMLLSNSEGFPIVAIEAAENKKILFISDLPICNELNKMGIKHRALNNNNVLDDFKKALFQVNSNV